MSESPEATIAELRESLDTLILERDEWRSQVVTIRSQQREALARADAAEADLRTLRSRAVVWLGGGDDLDVAAGRCCPTCRNSLAEHNRDVWNAGYAVGQRHAQELP